ncbi:hypothetical protein [Flavobacterium silvaticum]|uniref:GLPGLI family protein n=1 Tax=Flavobacterium silvaticum TaxID=1852020 RepID=A0A972FUP8_9FLAO|nr:hypothetical protein [Flavobacterium silvaticum]NMH27950.1 hypothetical protein [Flavobacterium silvaticum]
MKKKLLLLLLFIIPIGIPAQPNFVSKGKLMNTANQKFSFSNLRIKDQEVTFFDLETKSEFQYLLNSIKYIEDAEGTVVYGTKPEKKPTETKKPEPIISGYPDGIYMTKEDFLNHKPSKTEAVLPFTLTGFEKEFAPDEQQVMFYYVESDKKVKNTFAIFYRKNLYFQVDAILDNRNKKDRSQDSDFPNSFTKVLLGGEHLFYMETDLGNLWVKALAVNGGVPTSVVNSAKGIVWDIAKKEFNIFRDCKDFNLFVADIKPEATINCDQEGQYNPKAVRAIVEELK